MSRAKPDRKPLIALVHNADKAFQAHMVRSAHERGRPDIKPAHNFLFAILGDEGDRAANLAVRAGITRQSMGEVIRDLVDIGILEMAPDPQDGRAKIVRYTPEGKRFTTRGLPSPARPRGPLRAGVRCRLRGDAGGAGAGGRRAQRPASDPVRGSGSPSSPR